MIPAQLNITLEQSLKDSPELLKAYERLSARCSAVLLQEFVEGCGVGYFALMRDGEIVEFYSTMQDAYVTAKTFYADGRFSIQQVTDVILSRGINQFSISNAEQLPPGIYFINIVDSQRGGIAAYKKPICTNGFHEVKFAFSTV